MATPQTYAEYLAELNRQLSSLEKKADRATGLDERMDVTNKLLIEVAKTLGRGIQVQPLPKLFPGLPHYNVRRYTLDIARTEPGEEIRLPGDTITAYSDGSLDGIYVRLDKASNEAVPLNEFNPYHYLAGFQKFWLETPAQSGKYLRLHVGREAGADAAATGRGMGSATEVSLVKIVPIAKADAFNTALPAAEADWIATAITPTNSPSYLRIYVCASVAGVFRVARTIGASTLTENMNAGGNLVAGAGYLFTVPWRTGDSINVRYSVTGGTINRLIIDEFGAAE